MNQPSIIAVNKGPDGMSIYSIRMPDGALITQTTRKTKAEVFTELLEKMERDQEFKTDMQRQLNYYMSRRFKSYKLAAGRQK